jgi:orotidine-5'-phosphate decarboxylase
LVILETGEQSSVLSQMNTTKTDSTSVKNRVILALDTESLQEAQALVDELGEFIGVFKIGLQLFCNAGTAVFDFARERGVKLFFDGKFHDIPNTVAKASAAVAAQGVYMFNVHAGGGADMMRAAVKNGREAAKKAGFEQPMILAVTVLTSIGSKALNEELGVPGDVEEQVKRLAVLARECGMDGVVASAAEAAAIRAACGPDFRIVTPGVRPSWAATDDQVRIVTPGEALKNGADFIVVGRPITHAPDRREAAQKLLSELLLDLGVSP